MYVYVLTPGTTNNPIFEISAKSFTFRSSENEKVKLHFPWLQTILYFTFFYK